MQRRNKRCCLHELAGRDLHDTFNGGLQVGLFIVIQNALCQRFLPHHMDAFDDAIARSLERTAVVRITLTGPPVGKCKQLTEQ